MTSREILQKAQLGRWEWIRRLGFWRYVPRFGVIGFGLPMFIFTTFFVVPHQYTPLTAKHGIVCACIWPMVGALFGWLAWASSEKKYRKFMREVQPNKDLTIR